MQIFENKININLALAIADDGCVQKRSKTGKYKVFKKKEFKIPNFIFSTQEIKPTHIFHLSKNPKLIPNASIFWTI